jgi:hypothetical protein
VEKLFGRPHALLMSEEHEMKRLIAMVVFLAGATVAVIQPAKADDRVVVVHHRRHHRRHHAVVVVEHR